MPRLALDQLPLPNGNAMPTLNRDEAIAQAGIGGVIVNETSDSWHHITMAAGETCLNQTQPGEAPREHNHWQADNFLTTGWRVLSDEERNNAPVLYTRDEAIELVGAGGIITRGVYRYRVDRENRSWTLQRLNTWNAASSAPSRPDYHYATGYRVTDEIVGIEEVDREYIRMCEQCGDEIDTSSDYYDYCDECGCYNCSGCGVCCETNFDDEDDYRNDRYGVHSWDYKPAYVPKIDGGGALFGIELEVGGDRADISQVVRAHDDSEHHLYMKDDGSISGVEIVTHPATLDYVKTFPFTPLLEGLTREGSYIDDGYGLHIHVDRNAFRRAGKRSAPHQMAWLMFIYRNTSNLELLARRRESRWASFRKPAKGELSRKAMRAQSDDRYLAVNCNNRPTYELRFFKSTLDPQEFHGAVEFADASVEYTRVVKAPDILQGSALSWEHFALWVNDRSDRYPNLVNVLAEMVESPEERFATHGTCGGY